MVIVSIPYRTKQLAASAVVIKGLVSDPKIVWNEIAHIAKLSEEIANSDSITASRSSELLYKCYGISDGLGNSPEFVSYPNV